MGEQLGFTLRFPEGWSEVPTAPDAAATARRRFVFAPRETTTGEQVVRALASLEVRPRGGIDPDQLLARARSEQPDPAGVPAGSAPSAAPAAVPAATSVPPVPDREPEPQSGAYRLWRRQADVVELAGLPCVVVHDVFRPAAGGHPALQQRLLVTYFPPAAGGADDVAVQFTLSSPDLLAFDDFLAEGIAIAATLLLTERTPA